MLQSFLCVGAVLLYLCASLSLAAQNYHELLDLRVLPHAQLFASFDFRTTTPASSFEQSNFGYFPRALGQILQHTGTKELHLRFTTGRWDAESWGPRPRGGMREGSTGVELWAWMEATDSDKVDASWLRLTNALSGLFCSSLNFLDSTRTIEPLDTFAPEAQHFNLSHTDLRHGILAREVVCTENLTPFMKLMPCKGKAGISSLFDGHKLFDSTWQSMSIDVRPVCQPHSVACQIEVEQSVHMVLDIERSKRPQDDPIPRPEPQESLRCDPDKPYNQYGDSCYPNPGSTIPEFRVSQVFGRQIKGTCGLIEEQGFLPATICSNVSNSPVSVDTDGQYTERDFAGGIKCYQMPVGANFDLIIHEQPMPTIGTDAFDSVKVERAIRGRGQESGGLKSMITNNSPNSNASLVYLESLPWFVRPYLHTLRTDLLISDGSNSKGAVQKMNYRPARDRERPTMLEFTISIPPNSTFVLSYDFDKAILRYTEYPPDPNRGFEIAPAIVRILGRTGKPSTYMRTTSLLLYLPTPDFSMPYNVIILTSTVIALGFGSIFNLLVRRFVAADEIPALRIGRLREPIRRQIIDLTNKILKGNREKAE